MKQKLISIIRVLTVLAVITVAYYFGNEFSVLLTASYTFGELIANTASFGSTILILWMYSHYLSHTPLKEYDLGSPYCTRRWMLLSVLIPLGLLFYYLVYVNGTFSVNHLYPVGIVNCILSTLLYTGLFPAMQNGILFRGYLFHTLRNAWGNAAALVLIQLPVLFQLHGTHTGSPESTVLLVTSCILANTALCLVTLESGSIWPSVWMDALFRILFAHNLILQIDTVRDVTPFSYMTLITYTIRESNPLITRIDRIVSTDLTTTLPAMLASAAVIIYSASHLTVSRYTDLRHSERRNHS